MLKITKFSSILVLLLFSLNCNSQGIGVGINTNDPKSTLDINGNLSVKVATIFGGPGGSASPITDQGVYLNLVPSFGNQEFLVPNAASFPGRIYIMRNTSASTTALLYSLGGSFFAKNNNSLTSPPLVLQNNADTKTIILVSDGTNWTYIF
jgi:hypothetical protein